MLVTLERLAHTDINLLRELRNANADAFFDDTYITREAQEDWWYRYVNDYSKSPVARVLFGPDSGFKGSLKIYTVWLNNVTPVGFLSVNYLGAELIGDCHGLVSICEIGHILLAPAHRGRGIMKQALIEVRRLYDPLTFWIAHVKRSNTASLNLFAAQGFVQCDLKPTQRKSKSAISAEATDGA